jgi:membrane protein
MDRSSGKKGSIFDKLWDMDPEAAGGLKGSCIRAFQFVSFAFSNFMANDSLLRATSLSFTMLLSIVPLLALAFSVLKGLGAQNRLAPLLLSQVAAGSEVVVNRVISYIDNTNMGSVGALGLAGLFYTSISMLASIEEAFNAVWGITETRSFYRKFSDYLSVLVSAPLLFLAATSITTTLQSKRLISWLLESTYLGDVFLFFLSLTPYLSVWIALFFLYIFMPYTRVRYKSALIGAVLAGTLWQLAQWCYIHFQVGTGNYNAIYGTLAALPILMVWIYTSWIIVLFGMEVVAAHQGWGTFRRDIRGRDISQSLRELVALAALGHIAESFHEGGPGWNEEHLAVKLRIPLRIMHETLHHLLDQGFIVRSESAGGTFLPARELDQIALSQVILSLRSHGAACRIGGEDKARQILETVDAAVATGLGGLTLKDVASGEKIPPGVDKEGQVDI